MGRRACASARGFVCTSALAAGLIVAVFTYLVGAFEVMFADPSRMCERTESIPEVNAFEYDCLPLRAVCHWVNDQTCDVVSPWVNPILFVALGVVVACLIASPVSR